MPGPRSRRLQQGYLAFLGHRLSGILLALFLPFHFLVLGLALEGAGTLDGLLVLTDLWLVKVAEWGLVVLLALHMAFGTRLLVLELWPWPAPDDVRSHWIGWGAGAAFALGLVFLWQAA